MVKILSILSIILAIVLFPPAALALVSNNAVPGDFTYPIKRGLEAGIVKIASITPITRAWFSVERSNRRFRETTVLIVKGGNFSKTLDELVDQTVVAVKEINNVENPAQKKELVTKLSESIKKYDEGLAKAEQQLESNQASREAAAVPAPEPTTAAQAIQPAPTTAATQPTTVPQPVRSSQPASTPQVIVPTSIPALPIATIIPIPIPTPTQLTSTNPSGRRLEEARRRLEEIRRRLEEERSGDRYGPDERGSDDRESSDEPEPTDRDREDRDRGSRGRDSQR